MAIDDDYELSGEYHPEVVRVLGARVLEVERRTDKLDFRVSRLQDDVDQHTEVLAKLSVDMEPVASVARNLTDWALLFGTLATWIMTVVRFSTSPVGRKLVVFLILLWYYITHDRKDLLELILKVAL